MECVLFHIKYSFCDVWLASAWDEEEFWGFFNLYCGALQFDVSSLEWGVLLESLNRKLSLEKFRKLSEKALSKITKNTPETFKF
jgi:hypothetical protein